MRPRRSYLAYMVRLWQVEAGEGPVWRASLESPRTGVRQGFANLEELFDFLRAQTGCAPPSTPEPGQVPASEGGAPVNARSKSVEIRG